MKNSVLVAAILVLLVFVLIQLVPIGQINFNPPVVSEPIWDSPKTRALVVTHCFDCHSNQTTWPWYSRIAPARWLIAKDVQQGRRFLNFSDWNHYPQPLSEMVDEVMQGGMPPAKYTIAHPRAAFSETTRAIFIDALGKTFK